VVFPEEDQRAKAKLYSLLGSGANQILRSYAVVGYEEGSVNVPSLYATATSTNYYYRGGWYVLTYAEIRTPEGTFTQRSNPASVSRSNTIRSGPVSVEWSASAYAVEYSYYHDWWGYVRAWYASASVAAPVKFKPSSQATYILVIPKSQADRFGGVQGAQVINGYYVFQVNGEKTIFNLASSQSRYGEWWNTAGTVSASTPGGPLNVYAFKVVPR